MLLRERRGSRGGAEGGQGRRRKNYISRSWLNNRMFYTMRKIKCVCRLFYMDELNCTDLRKVRQAQKRLVLEWGNPAWNPFVLIFSSFLKCHVILSSAANNCAEVWFNMWTNHQDKLATAIKYYSYILATIREAYIWNITKW